MPILLICSGCGMFGIPDPIEEYQKRKVEKERQEKVAQSLKEKQRIIAEDLSENDKKVLHNPYYQTNEYFETFAKKEGLSKEEISVLKDVTIKLSATMDGPEFGYKKLMEYIRQETDKTNYKFNDRTLINIIDFFKSGEFDEYQLSDTENLKYVICRFPDEESLSQCRDLERKMNGLYRRVSQRREDNLEIKLNQQWFENCKRISSLKGGMNGFFNWVMDKKQMSEGSLSSHVLNFRSLSTGSKEYMISYTEEYLDEFTPVRKVR